VIFINLFYKFNYLNVLKDKITLLSEINKIYLYNNNIYYINIK